MSLLLKIRRLVGPLAGLVVLSLPLPAQNYFPDTIPTSPLEVFIREVATLPDASANRFPRMSVLTSDPAARIFVNDQLGPLYLLDFSGGTPAAVTEYLDLRDYPELQLRTATGEQGFQAFAFHPDFHRGGGGYGRFYTIHSSNQTSQTPDFDPGGSTDFHTVLLEWRTADPDSDQFAPVPGQAAYRELLRFKQPFSNHNGGLIAFNPTAGPDDYGLLYIALGDGGSGGDPQENGEDPSNPYGAILRIDPLGDDSANGAYGIVDANQFAADSDSATLAEIFCYGLRNPQRFGWDAQTGRLFIADIGQNAVEEINLAANGAHFGWDLREGSFAFESTATAGLTDPVAEYDHSNPVNDLPTTIGNRAVTVGEVFRGEAIPALDGRLLFGDFPTGLLLILDVDTDPLDGGQDGISQLIPKRPDGSPVHLIDLINEARGARNISPTRRADLRYGLNTPGRIFVLNKHDGIVRELVAPPSIAIERSGAQVRIDFTGTLQESGELVNESFETIAPQPESPWFLDPEEGPRFFRSRIE